VSVYQKVNLSIPLIFMSRSVIKKRHIDEALCYLHKKTEGKPMSFTEISEFTGIKYDTLNLYYQSGLEKLRKQLDINEFKEFLRYEKE